jgi:two-component system, OmpR family, response regulator
MRILLVEDEDRVAAAVSAYLAAEGFEIRRAADGERARDLAAEERFAAVILDLGLPGIDGLTLLRGWRAAGERLPVLVLSARGDWQERVDGIDAGADDYLPKPFRQEELLARLRALLRRTGQPQPAMLLEGRLRLDTRRCQLFLDEVPVDLSPLEYRLVTVLMQHAGQVVTQRALTEALYAQDFERESNAVEVMVGRVRRKLGPNVIHTEHGRGYWINRTVS